MEDIVSLPLGFIDTDGNVIRDVVITGMTAKIRKALTNAQFRNRPQHLISYILKQCIKSIGDKDKLGLGDIQIMTASDREYLFVMIRRLSLGNEIHARFQCPYCNELQDVTIDIDSLDYREGNPDDFEIANQRYIATFHNKAMKLTVKMKLPCGYDLEDVSKIKDPMEANYAIYELCLVEWNGKNGPFDQSFVEDIPVAADDWLTEQLGKVQPGFDLRPKYACVECGCSSIVSLEDSDFLFKIQR